MDSKENKKTTRKAKESKTDSEKTVRELKLDLQKLVLDVRSGKESDTSKVKKLKKEIARLLTKKAK